MVAGTKQERARKGGGGQDLGINSALQEDPAMHR